MAELYFVLSIMLAVSLNSANRFIRAAGTLLAALALFMISASILLANFDGTFARFQPHDLIDQSKTALLNIQAALGLGATLFLLWATGTQVRRRETAPTQARNTADGFGLVSRYAHWTTATLMLLLIPMGTFLSVLPASEDRTSFLAAHQALGLTILIVVILRIAWLLASPPPRHDDLPLLQRRLASSAHLALYVLILAFPISGFLMSNADVGNVQFYGWALPHLGDRSASSQIWRTMHDAVLPLVFYAVIGLHIGAVLMHHFLDRRVTDVRRMLR